MSTYNGVIVYEILPNGCLNGVYSNDHKNTKNEIFNEIARKKQKEDTNKIEGIYSCSYIDLNSEVFECDLEITANNGRYEFIWTELVTGVTKFTGTGWLTRQNQITVMYKN